MGLPLPNNSILCVRRPLTLFFGLKATSLDKVPFSLYVPTDDGKDTGKCKAQSRYLDDNKRGLSFFTRLKMSATICKVNCKETCRYVLEKIEKYNEKSVINSSVSGANKIN